MSLKHFQFLFSLLLLPLIGCYEKSTSDGDSIVCTALALPGLTVNVFDQETGFANACGATVPYRLAALLKKLPMTKVTLATIVLASMERMKEQVLMMLKLAKKVL